MFRKPLGVMLKISFLLLIIILFLCIDMPTSLSPERFRLNLQDDFNGCRETEVLIVSDRGPKAEAQSHYPRALSQAVSAWKELCFIPGTPWSTAKANRCMSCVCPGRAFALPAPPSVVAINCIVTDFVSVMEHLAGYFSNTCKGHNFSHSDLTLLILSWEEQHPLQLYGTIQTI